MIAAVSPDLCGQLGVDAGRHMNLGFLFGGIFPQNRSSLRGIRHPRFRSPALGLPSTEHRLQSRNFLFDHHFIIHLKALCTASIRQEVSVTPGPEGGVRLSQFYIQRIGEGRWTAGPVFHLVYFFTQNHRSGVPLRLPPDYGVGQYLSSIPITELKVPQPP